jgi:hypothetical protein
LWPAAVKASAMSRAPTEPNSLPSVEALAGDRHLGALEGGQARLRGGQHVVGLGLVLGALGSNAATLDAVAGTALPCGTRKLRP